MRYDFHTHTVYSDGELIPSELIRRAKVLGHKVIAITDHADYTNYKDLINKALIAKELEKYIDIKIIAGIEITHVPPKIIGKLAKKAKNYGAEIVLVHGETIVEPVEEKTNYFASLSEDVDILAHPGIVDRETAENLKENNIFLEITSRRGHSLTNGHTLKIAREFNIPFLVNTDTHSPDDLIDTEFAKKICYGCGMSEKEKDLALRDYPKELLKKLGVL
ncbi:histidinol phosphate phosphatase domain-containing protein [Methanocaldococcus sp.]